MVSCDVCEVWQHTRCNRIGDKEHVPSTFLCSGCREEVRGRVTRAHKLEVDDESSSGWA
jgi:hypothetical protein